MKLHLYYRVLLLNLQYNQQKAASTRSTAQKAASEIKVPAKAASTTTPKVIEDQEKDTQQEAESQTVVTDSPQQTIPSNSKILEPVSTATKTVSINSNNEQNSTEPVTENLPTSITIRSPRKSVPTAPKLPTHTNTNTISTSSITTVESSEANDGDIEMSDSSKPAAKSTSAAPSTPKPILPASKSITVAQKISTTQGNNNTYGSKKMTVHLMKTIVTAIAMMTAAVRIVLLTKS